MKILFFSDLHCHNYEQYHTILPSGRNSRLQDCLNILDQICDEVVKQDIDHVIFLGDAFEVRTRVDQDVYVSTFLGFKRISEAINGELVVLVGNHDQYERNSEKNWLTPFDTFARVIAKPDLHYLTKGQETISVVCVPHSADIGYIQQWITDLSVHDLFLFHQGLSEATVGPYDKHVKTELSVNDLPLDRCKLAIGGDFHKRQFLKGRQVHYVGSPLQLSFSERDETKCFSVVDTKDWGVTSIPTSAPRFYLFNSIQEFNEAGFPDFDKHFIRVRDTNEVALRELQEKHPRIQTEWLKEDEPLLEKVDDLEVDDQALMTEFVNQTQSHLDEIDLVNEGLDLLRPHDVAS